MKLFTPLLVFIFWINFVSSLNMGRNIFLRDTTSMISSNFLNSLGDSNKDKEKSKIQINRSQCKKI